MLLDVSWNRYIGFQGEQEPAARYTNQTEVILVSISFAKTKATRDCTNMEPRISHAFTITCERQFLPFHKTSYARSGSMPHLLRGLAASQLDGRDSSVATVTMLRTKIPRSRVSIPGRVKRF
jgi:hypothetical protein